jgi:hypothetical protein
LKTRDIERLITLLGNEAKHIEGKLEGNQEICSPHDLTAAAELLQELLFLRKRLKTTQEEEERIRKDLDSANDRILEQRADEDRRSDILEPGDFSWGG